VIRTLQTARQSGLPVQLWCESGLTHPFFRALERTHGCVLKAQRPGDLGQRMHAVFVAAEQALLLVGSDCPGLDAPHLQQAAQRLLAGDEAVFTPAEDGGYVLVGLRRPQAELFTGIDWSTDRVMAQTRERLQRLGLRYSEMPMLWDVDRPEDWQRFVATADCGTSPTQGRCLGAQSISACANSRASKV